MPGDEETEGVIEKPKRAPRKRASASVPNADGETSAPVKRAPRKRATPKKIVEEESQPARVESEPTPRRKAPTGISTTKATRKSAKRQVVIVLFMMILGVGSSAAVGISDKGKIDINKIIEDRNRRVDSGELQEQIIPVQNTSRLPDGGLIMADDQTPPAPAPVATSTASTTNATASSTASSTPVEMGIPATPMELGQPEPVE